MKKAIAIILTLVLVLGCMAGCAPKPLVKTGKFVCNEVAEVPASEYVICVSKAIPDAQTILAEINKAIEVFKKTEIVGRDGEKYNLMQLYKEGSVPLSARARELFEINNVLRENENDDPLMVFAQVYYPFNFGGPYGAYTDGIDAVICSEAAVAMGRSIVFTERPLSFSYEQVKAGKGDVLISAIPKTDELAKDFLLSNVYETGKQYIVADEGFNFTKIKDLNREGLRIGVIAGRVGEEVINEAVAKGTLKGVNVVVFDTDKEAKVAIINENVDCVVLDELPAKQMADELLTDLGKYV